MQYKHTQNNIFIIKFASVNLRPRRSKTLPPNSYTGVGMCGTQEPMGSGVPGGTHPIFKNMGSGGFRVPGRNPKSGFQVGTQKVGPGLIYLILLCLIIHFGVLGSRVPGGTHDNL